MLASRRLCHLGVRAQASAMRLGAIRSKANTVCGTDPIEDVIAKLTLQDGTVFEGISFGADKPVHGEVVFTTGMVGYTESLTDPSYRGQVRCTICFNATYMLIFAHILYTLDSYAYIPYGW
jgi:Carbamoyl-phosphate synthase small chain, CPSase domain